MSLILGGHRVNTFDQEVPQFDDDENLYLKGGEGSMAIIDLFTGPMQMVMEFLMNWNF